MDNFNVVDGNSCVVINGDVIYAPQQAWVMSSSIRENIVFFNKFNAKRYEEVVKACQLEKDFKEIDKGDQAQINSSSANISGGQKARISLARAVYKNADVYLFDDPLASVDQRVGNKIFNDVFCEFLKGKTRILVTGEVNNISKADKIIYMNEGRIEFCGDYQSFSDKYNNDILNGNFSDDDTENQTSKDKGIIRFMKRKLSEKDDGINPCKISSKKSSACQGQGEETKVEKSAKSPLEILNDTANLDKSKMWGKFSIFKSYIKIQGGWVLFSSLILLSLVNLAVNKYRKKYIISLGKGLKKHDGEKSFGVKAFSKERFWFYILISSIDIIINLLFHSLVIITTIKSLKNIHENMIVKFIRAPINLFHDLVPIGTIMNRLTKDIEYVQLIIRFVNFFSRTLISLLISFTICFYYNKITLFLGVLLFLFAINLNKFYIKGATELGRLHRISYDPILTIITETIKGIDVIRTENVEKNFRELIYKRLDDHFGVHLYIEGSKQWYNLVLRIASSLFNFACLFYMVLYREAYDVHKIGFVLDCTHDLLTQLVTIMGFWSKLQMSLICLERCEAVNKIPQEIEPPSKEEASKQEKNLSKINWPSNGKINFVNFSAKYRESTPEILRNINIQIEGGEKVGIVGRTGSGKSSLVLSLARIIEATKGKIVIDSIDIKTLNLDYLRQKISIVPQDPFLIEGTVKENIDILNKFDQSSEFLTQIIDDFCLFKDTKMSSEEKLSKKINQGGDNISIGQRQLICFIRAAIKRSKIVVLDEATASIDKNTEIVLSKNIGKYFKDCTMIIIAHHINMVKDCERIIVINSGKIVETGGYKELLSDKSSFFYALNNESKIS